MTKDEREQTRKEVARRRHEQVLAQGGAKALAEEATTYIDCVDVTHDDLMNAANMLSKASSLLQEAAISQSLARQDQERLDRDAEKQAAKVKQPEKENAGE